MKRHELVELLNEIAELDKMPENDIYDHPCSVAVRALEQAVEDIDSLRAAAINGVKCKHIQALINMDYDPSY